MFQSSPGPHGAGRPARKSRQPGAPEVSILARPTWSRASASAALIERIRNVSILARPTWSRASQGVLALTSVLAGFNPRPAHMEPGVAQGSRSNAPSARFNPRPAHMEPGVDGASALRPIPRRVSILARPTWSRASVVDVGRLPQLPLFQSSPGPHGAGRPSTSDSHVRFEDGFNPRPAHMEPGVTARHGEACPHCCFNPRPAHMEPGVREVRVMHDSSSSFNPRPAHMEPGVRVSLKTARQGHRFNPRPAHMEPGVIVLPS